ncbi:response regulator transcription factor [Catenuloplanes atrovinosus]|uniref:DNA-binding NarL/FixJ family response regulator n=1 Tax=Catenuloplanes atrovinosus TaxID=137266 RepID=A0AAE3YPX0_9ACTN|nr:response regulator transcription factor [Catenuloplanes atrovinosus]MDR7276467.1 DNA-binding NarL/FixJ family response regulator [Catenuloplanes atrovinosus]
MIRLLIVDDHPVVRHGLRGVLSTAHDVLVVGEAGDGPAAVRAALALEPDVILLDLRMPGGDGVTAAEDLARAGSRARVLVLTTYDTDGDIMRAVHAGATGYLLKDAPPAELIRAVRAAAHGGSVLAPAVASRILAHLRHPEPAAPRLSAREIEVLRTIAAGHSNRACAAELFISEATVKTHLLHIYDKLGVTDRAAAVAAAYELGLLGEG